MYCSGKRTSWAPAPRAVSRASSALASLPAMSPTVGLSWASATRTPRLSLDAPPEPELGEPAQFRVVGRGDTQEVAPGESDDALRARSARQDHRLAGRYERGLERPA